MAPILPPSFRHLAFGDVESTNAICMEKAKLGEAPKLWVTAERQLKGRGSRGRSWVSEKGNLYASLLLAFDADNHKLHTLSFVASLAIHDAVCGVAGKSQKLIGLKWPNDVLIEDGKTCGILLESMVQSNQTFVVIGMGINIAHHPEGTTHKATNLTAMNINTTPVAFFEQLAQRMAFRLSQWDNGNGFCETRRDWLKHVVGIGKVATIQLPSKTGMQELSGTLKDVDDGGRLILETEAGQTHKLSVADIFFA